MNDLEAAAAEVRTATLERNEAMQRCQEAGAAHKAAQAAWMAAEDKINAATARLAEIAQQPSMAVEPSETEKPGSLLECAQNAERWMYEHGCSHEYPVLRNLRDAIANVGGKFPNRLPDAQGPGRPK